MKTQGILHGVSTVLMVLFDILSVGVFLVSLCTGMFGQRDYLTLALGLVLGSLAAMAAVWCARRRRRMMRGEGQQ